MSDSLMCTSNALFEEAGLVGEMSEYYQEAELEESAALDAALDQQARDCENGIWRTHDRSAVKIVTMSDSHLRNALSILRRKGFVGAQPSDTKQTAYVQDELDAIPDAEINPYVDLLGEELKRRGLKEIEP